MSNAPPASRQEPDSLAAGWLQQLLAARDGIPRSTGAPTDPDRLVPALAALCAALLARGERLLIVTADDQLLPDISNALDLALRPLCLVLPDSSFTAPITLRASLSLMRSRLARAADDEAPAPWRRQREGIEARAEAWQAALAWSASENSDPWPEDIVDLFPVCITPRGRAERLSEFDHVLSLFVEVASADLNLMPTAGGAEFLGALVVADPDLLVRAELEAVAQEIADMELELATVQGELAEFTHRYHEQVGSRITRLDQLQAELAQALAARMPDDPTQQEEAEAIRARAEQSRQEEERYRRAAAEDANESTPFRPSSDLKKLFRQVAQKIHPDRARSDADRHWRNRLMAEANRAYRAGDSATLREVMALWQEGGGEPREDYTDSIIGSRNERQLDQLKARQGEIQRELNRLFGSRLYELFLAERMARRAARNLLDEMARKLDLQIDDVETRLAALGD